MSLRATTRRPAASIHRPARACAGPAARPGPKGSASLRRPAPDAVPGRPGNPAACGCPRRRSRAPAASWAAPAATAGCTRPAGRGRAETGRPATTSTWALQAQPVDVVARAGQRARVQVGGHDAPHAAARQDRRQHAGAGADVEGQLASTAAARRRPGRGTRRAPARTRRSGDGCGCPGGAPSAGTSTPFLRHSCAPTRPSSSRSAATDGWPSGGPQASRQAWRRSGARGRAMP